MILTNALDHLVTPTHDGSGQATHPDVIDFLIEHGMPSWGGYRYWMVMTPLPFASDVHEDPNVLASHDGLTWVVPAGLVNPLHDARTAQNPGFDSDTDMVYNPDTNELWVYYRYITSTKYEIHLVKISANMSYTAPLIVFEISPYNTSMSSKTRSMTICRESAGKWHMWGLSGDETSPVNVYHFASADGINWGEPHDCLNKDGIDVIQAALPGSYIWHFVVKPNHREQRFEFICQTRGVSRALYHMYCAMEKPTLLEFAITSAVVSPSGISGRWDQVGLYRSAFVIEHDRVNNQYIYHVWYAGVDSDNAYQIGFTSGVIGTYCREIGLKGGYRVNFGYNFKVIKPPALASDNFDRADNPSNLGVADTGQAWEVVSGTWGIIGNTAYTSVAVASTSYAVLESGESDCEVSCTLAAGVSNARNRIVFRYSDPDNLFYIVPTTTGYSLSKRQAGSISTIGSYTKTLQSGDVMKIRMSGENIKFYVNDILAVETNQAFNKSATKHGLGCYNSTLGRFDNFKVEELA